VRGLDIVFPPPDRRSFARRAERCLQDLGITGAIQFDSDKFALAYRDSRSQEQTTGLANAHADCRRAWPWRRSRLLREFFIAILAAPTTPSAWSEAKELVLPAVRHRIAFEVIRLPAQVAGQVPPEYPSESLPGGLVTALAVDSATSISLPNRETQASWGIPFSQALAQAVANLDARSEPRWTLAQQGLYVSAWHDDYDCSRIHSNRALRGLAVEGRMVAILPDKNCLVVTGLGDPEALRAAFVLAAERHNPRPVSLIPLVRSWPAWEALELHERHPCYDLWRRLVLTTEAEVYEQQKTALESLFHSMDRDVFVASFIVEEDEDGHPRSRSVWTRDVLSLLPETDLVALVDPSRPRGEELLGWFEWSTIVEECGDRFTPTSYYPIRHQGQGFPNAAELARLRVLQAGPPRQSLQRPSVPPERRHKSRAN
jgi:hypothetical protein